MDSKASALIPPFSAEAGLIPSQAGFILPAVVRQNRFAPIMIPTRNMRLFLEAELRTTKLDNLHDYLWLAGLPLPARPLHRQKMMGRHIYITEQPDEHLIWYKTKLLLKPLPEYLLCYAFWTKHLCSDARLHQSAVGLLLSYTWLVERRSDFDLAKEMKLIPKAVEWAAWTDFVHSFLSNIHLDTSPIYIFDRRYQYGELRLTRLNTMTRILPSMWSCNNFVRGYLSSSTWHQEFFERNFSWLFPAFVFLSVILSAMQVGLATEQLNGSQAFGNLSYVGVLSTVAIVIVGAGMMWTVWFVLFWYHLLSAVALRQRDQRAKHTALYEKA